MSIHIAIVVLTTTLFAFQNCGSSHRVYPGLSTTQSSETPEDLSKEPLADGEQDASSLSLNLPRTIVLDNDADPNFAYIADTGLQAIVAIDLNNQTLSYLAHESSGGSGPTPRRPTSVALGPLSGNLYFCDTDLDAIVVINSASGDRSFVSQLGTRGVGPDFEEPTSMVINSQETTAYIMDSELDAIIEIDLQTGNRQILSDAARGTGPTFTFSLAMALSANGNHIDVVDMGTISVIRVNIDNGNRTTVSSNLVGQGTFLGIPTSVDSIDQNQLYILDTFTNGEDNATITGVSIGNGNRQIISGPDVGQGPVMKVPESLALSNTHAYVVDSSLDALFKIDLATGDREIIYGGE